ncbi:M67 family metallopeptidase [Frigoriglobus tundricola]|uniref:MPN domain-containing protein n=1 Tax=Frigoriglobus tundricola TaxID=2774151 RepID=A0A6M5YTG5_9BACT|nr:M67 family metallopeptidase [Frigoriglobus tundricola]QJW96222.1 hypothetical protein FTUN_3779 [Frigoriglobus tundricola]
MFSRLSVPDLLFEEVIAHARLELPNECCGLLAGHVAAGAGVVTTRFTIGNDANSPTEYETNPRDLLTAFRRLRGTGADLLAIYHSHPTSAPVPSRRDVERNTYGETVVHVIVSLAGAEPEVRGWLLTEAGGREVPLEVTHI